MVFTENQAFELFVGIVVVWLIYGMVVVEPAQACWLAWISGSSVQKTIWKMLRCASDIDYFNEVRKIVTVSDNTWSLIWLETSTFLSSSLTFELSKTMIYYSSTNSSNFIHWLIDSPEIAKSYILAIPSLTSQGSRFTRDSQFLIPSNIQLDMSTCNITINYLMKT